MHLINSYLIIQILLILIVCVVLHTYDFFFLILNSLMFLFIISAYLWFLDFDIFVSFLVILDLGLFIIFLLLAVHLFSLFSSIYTNFGLNAILFTILFGLLLIPTDADLIHIWVFNISFHNWYLVYNLTHLSDLHIMYECYFNLTSLEFILMNFYLYLVIIFIFFFIRTFDVYKFSRSLTPLVKLFFSKKRNLLHVLKRQDLNLQRAHSTVTKVWSSNL